MDLIGYLSLELTLLRTPFHFNIGSYVFRQFTASQGHSEKVCYHVYCGEIRDLTIFILI